MTGCLSTSPPSPVPLGAEDEADTDRLALAIRKPEVVGTDIGSVDIQFMTGPSVRVFNYTVKCVAEGDDCSAAAVGTTSTGDLTRSISTIDATISGLFPNTTYWCYVAASSGKFDKCQGPLVAKTNVSSLEVNLASVAYDYNGGDDYEYDGWFLEDIADTNTADTLSGPFHIPEGGAVWTSLSGLRQVLLWQFPDLTSVLYYVDDITAWIESAAVFPDGWEAITGEIPEDIVSTQTGTFDVSGDGLLACTYFDYSLYGVQDFTAPGATWDFEYPQANCHGVSLDGDRGALAQEGDGEASLVLVENIWSDPSRSFTTVVDFGNSGVFVESLSLSGPYLAYITTNNNYDDGTLYYVDLTSVDDLSVELPTPVEIPLPQSWTDGSVIVEFVSITGTQMAITGDDGEAPTLLATTNDFTTVTATTWTEFDSFPTENTKGAQIDISYPILP